MKIYYYVIAIGLLSFTSRSREYKVNQMCKVYALTVDSTAQIVLKIQSRKKFEIYKGDILKVISGADTLNLICTKTSGYNASLTQSGLYYNAAFFPIDERLKSMSVNLLLINSLKIVVTHANAIKKSLAN